MRQRVHRRLARRQDRPEAQRLQDNAANDARWFVASQPYAATATYDTRLPDGSGIVLGSILGLLCWMLILAAVVQLTS